MYRSRHTYRWPLCPSEKNEDYAALEVHSFFHFAAPGKNRWGSLHRMRLLLFAMLCQAGFFIYSVHRMVLLDTHPKKKLAYVVVIRFALLS